MLLRVAPDLLEQAQNGKVSDEAFIDCIRTSLPYAWGMSRDSSLNPKVIQARLGHATIAETMDTYGHLFPDDDDLGRGAVETMIAALLAEQDRNSGT
ncbi:hypothetical protein [Microbispora sp. ATCC PTA-5024]|uniref:hypothetical protein n=1 Tax=Microbispora sp. ATCC PTA-5024 TaxID=316330 RepID=UPI0003DC1024|nr:hypothetical protein [Microbispora sp. ATCC PTA-5024]ETK32369.1 hypothetical protein MPTA5024_30195 [Microbispora sp. ATCC PTA-5024]